MTMEVTMKFAGFSIVTSRERNAAILDVREALSKSGGWVEEQLFFSNKAATIRFEIPGDALDRFQNELRERSLKPYIEGALPTDVTGDLKGTVSLTFSHQEADLKRDVPPFG